MRRRAVVPSAVGLAPSVQTRNCDIQTSSLAPATRPRRSHRFCGFLRRRRRCRRRRRWCRRRRCRRRFRRCSCWCWGVGGLCFLRLLRRRGSGWVVVGACDGDVGAVDELFLGPAAQAAEVFVIAVVDEVVFVAAPAVACCWQQGQWCGR